MPIDRLSDLSPGRQQLVRLFQAINYGQIQGLTLHDGDPVFSPEPIVFVDVKLGADNGCRPEVRLSDFNVPQEISELLRQLDRLQNGVVELIDVRAGLPRRMTRRASLAEARAHASSNRVQHTQP